MGREEEMRADFGLVVEATVGAGDGDPTRVKGLLRRGAPPGGLLDIAEYEHEAGRGLGDLGALKEEKRKCLARWKGIRGDDDDGGGGDRLGRRCHVQARP